MGEWCAGADRPRGGGPRLTALMPCKRELDATNPGAAFLREAGFEVRPLHNYSSIFAAYSAGVGSLQPEQDDIVMLVHDDVAFDGSPAALRQSLQRHLAYPGVGFVGAAGTRRLQPELVWWRGQSDMTTLAGMCHHGLRPSDPASFRSFFGPFGRVVVLDGVLLAATGRTLRSVRPVAASSTPSSTTTLPKGPKKLRNEAGSEGRSPWWHMPASVVMSLWPRHHTSSGCSRRVPAAPTNPTPGYARCRCRLCRSAAGLPSKATSSCTSITMSSCSGCRLPTPAE